MSLLAEKFSFSERLDGMFKEISAFDFRLSAVEESVPSPSRTSPQLSTTDFRNLAANVHEQHQQLVASVQNQHRQLAGTLQEQLQALEKNFEQKISHVFAQVQILDQKVAAANSELFALNQKFALTATQVQTVDQKVATVNSEFFDFSQKFSSATDSISVFDRMLDLANQRADHLVRKVDQMTQLASEGAQSAKKAVDTANLSAQLARTATEEAQSARKAADTASCTVQLAKTASEEAQSARKAAETVNLVIQLAKTASEEARAAKKVAEDLTAQIARAATQPALSPTQLPSLSTHLPSSTVTLPTVPLSTLTLQPGLRELPTIPAALPTPPLAQLSADSARIPRLLRLFNVEWPVCSHVSVSWQPKTKLFCFGNPSCYDLQDGISPSPACLCRQFRYRGRTPETFESCRVPDFRPIDHRHDAWSFARVSSQPRPGATS